MAGVVVFDLDTLLDLGPLAKERRRAQWGPMRKRAGEARAYVRQEGELAVLELPQWVRELEAKVGVVTDLPRPVARALMDRFGIECDAVLDASAGLAVAPDAATVTAILDRMGVGAEQALVVGASAAGFGAAANAGALSVGVAWAGSGPSGWPGWQPDIGLHRSDDLLDALQTGRAMRPVAEVLADGGEPVVHSGSLLVVAEDVFAAGRHLTSCDRRLADHKLSKLIVAAKSHPREADRLGGLLAGAADLSDLPSAELVASVPHRPDAEFDRFAVARREIAAVLRATDGTGALEMVRTCENYTDLDRDQRRMANHGRFKATRPLQGESVVLIDDVITSGSQTRACARELLAAGAGRVWTLVAAESQDPLLRDCPHCGEGTMRRVYGRIGPFLACTRYGCNYTEAWSG